MSRPPRIVGFSYLGSYRYFLTICTRERAPAFLEEPIARSTIDQFLITANEECFAILAYCLMPDHMHMLVEGTADGSDLRRFVKMAKQRSGATFARTTGSPLWQEGYFDRVLREEEDTKGIARYILENPVRAGLVSWPADYSYLGSGVWSIAELLEGTARLSPGP